MGINIKFYQWCRDIYSWKLIDEPPIKLGGPGAIIVQIDETVFVHQEKVIVILIIKFTKLHASVYRVDVNKVFYLHGFLEWLTPVMYML